MMCLYYSTAMLSHLNLALKGFFKRRSGYFSNGGPCQGIRYTTKQAGHSQTELVQEVYREGGE